MEHHLAVAEASLKASQAAPPLRPLRYRYSTSVGGVQSSPGTSPTARAAESTGGPESSPLVDKMMDMVHYKAEASGNPAAVYSQVWR